MPASIKGACRGRPRCPNRAVRRGLCSECEKAYDDRRGSPADRGYGSEWRALRARVLREEPFCRCGCGDPSEEVDHIIPKSQGGTDDRSNLQGLSKSHHSAKTMRQSVADH